MALRHVDLLRKFLDVPTFFVRVAVDNLHRARSRNHESDIKAWTAGDSTILEFVRAIGARDAM
jgi:hypothetical protein